MDGKLDKPDHDILIETYTMVRDLHKTVFGNGREGLLEAMATVEADMRNMRNAHDNLREDFLAQVPTTKEKNFMKAGGGVGISAFVLWLVTEILPKIKLT